MHRVVHLFLYLLRFPFVIAISLSHWILIINNNNNNHNNNNNNNNIYRGSPTRQGGFQWGQENNENLQF